MRGKSLLNENAIIILSLNQSEWRKLLRSASSRIGFSLDTGIEERACRSSQLLIKYVLNLDPRQTYADFSSKLK